MTLPYSELTFFETDEFFYLLPKVDDDNPKDQILLINRQNGQVQLKDNANLHLANLPAYTSKSIYGIFGTIQLIQKYLILITKIVQVGDITGQPIYRIEAVQLVPYQQSELHLTDQQKIFNRQYLQMVTTFLQAPFFFFSYSYDLSRSQQSLYQEKVHLDGQSLYRRADRRFVWNQHLLADFAAKPELTGFCIPIIYGFFSTHQITVNSKQFTLILLSRRSVDRAGTRMFSRGVDEAGNVSNFVETEQMVVFNEELTSLVQIRGSIPLHWSQFPDLRYKPPPTLAPTQAHHESFYHHLLGILPPFESVVLVNLINHTGQEEVLLTKMRQVFDDITGRISQPVHLESFDFHHECRHNRWDRLSLLLESIGHFIDSFGYFSTSAKGEYHLQRGIFRTNCIDSLDRTNVVQSLIAKTSLERQLQHFDIISVGERVEDYADFYHVYRNVWADNADACSIQYAGTPALKTDFTRTGKRRFIGKVKDGINSMVRYYKNNFEDGFRQDGIDLILGQYRVAPEEGNTISCPLAKRNMLKIVAFPLALLVLLSALFFVLLVPTTSGRSSEKAFNLLLWGLITSTVLGVMLKFGHHFVDYPTLVQVKPEVIEDDRGQSDGEKISKDL